jgi:uncharacterized protein YdhG (YjbR/CyaY superfamily)
MDKEEKSQQIQNVDDYMKTLPQEVKEELENLRKNIKASAPMAEEVISYNIPTYKYHGTLIHFFASKNNCSLIVVSKWILEKFKDELKDYDTSGTTIHFTLENPIPSELVKKIVQERIKENELMIKNIHK